VVATILMTQKASVTRGTLLSAAFAFDGIGAVSSKSRGIIFGA
jgi:hypothetical protein